MQFLELLQSERWLIGGGVAIAAFAEVVSMVVLPVRVRDGLLGLLFVLSLGVVLA